jgi:hypothetical protein
MRRPGIQFEGTRWKKWKNSHENVGREESDKSPVNREL